MTANNVTLCPSSRSDSEESKIFGIVNGTVDEPRITYLKEQKPLNDELLSLTKSVTPTEVFRFAAPCVETKCKHFDGKDCRLATRIVKILPKVAETLPVCSIRRNCKWWKQEGQSACERCPQVLTDSYDPSELAIKVS